MTASITLSIDFGSSVFGTAVGVIFDITIFFVALNILFNFGMFISSKKLDDHRNIEDPHHRNTYAKWLFSLSISLIVLAINTLFTLNIISFIVLIINIISTCLGIYIYNQQKKSTKQHMVNK